jgi:parallel beta-helix repeat protein
MNKKILIAGLLVSVMLFVPINSAYTNISNQTDNKPVNSSNRGNTLYVGGNGGDNYTRIQDAIDNASDGDTVFVYDDSSPYYENVVIDKSISLIGEDRNTTIIDSSGTGDTVHVSVNQTNISGFTIKNCGNIWYPIDAGIDIRSNYCIISNNKILNNYVGIYLDFCSNNIIADNIISSNNLHGIFLRNQNYNNTISGNKINSNKRSGLYIRDYSDKNIVKDNDINFNNYWGIIIVGSEGNIIYNNNISINMDGIYLGVAGNKNTIFENNISNNNNGVFLRSSRYNIIKYNNILGNHENCIELQNSHNNTIYFNNIVYSLNFGIYIWDYSNFNKIYHNNLINMIIAYDSCSNIWDNNYPSGGNYWSDYNGIDADGDGIGDSPYLIPGGNNEDRYPLMYSTVVFPPFTPIITGPLNGKIGTLYNYTFKTVDPNGDKVRYIIEWGDSTSNTTGFYQSGTNVIESHIWYKKGSYLIIAKAEDESGLIGAWGALLVKIPRDKSISSSSLFKFLERYPLLNRIFNIFVKKDY